MNSRLVHREEFIIGKKDLARKAFKEQCDHRKDTRE